MTMSELRRLCRLCLAESAADDELACPECLLSHNARKGTVTTEMTKRNAVSWWGPTTDNTNPEDLEIGYSVDEA